jgi:S-adenosylmethionine:tRNA ribosyltransferase-isomerase
VTAGSRTSDYDFSLPADRIAQTPLDRRDESRLMLVERDTGRITHRVFRDIVDLFAPGDALVLNTTKVFRARLWGVATPGRPPRCSCSAHSETTATRQW